MTVQKKYTTYRSHALLFVEPRDGLALYARGRDDRAQDLTKIATQAVAGLQAVGVNVDIVIK